MKPLNQVLFAGKPQQTPFFTGNNDEQLRLFSLSDNESKEDTFDKDKVSEEPVVIECGTMGENSEYAEPPPEMLAPPSPAFIQKLHFVINFLANFLAGVAEFLNDVMTGFKRALNIETKPAQSTSSGSDEKGFGGYL